MYLLDTNVLSELRKEAAGRADPAVTAWSASVDPLMLFVSAITIYELEIGALQRERRDPAQGRDLRLWLNAKVALSFEGRILPIDAAIAKRCAGLNVPDPRPFKDALIAATALVHDMTVVTRNVRDFAPMGVRIIDPWAQ